MSKAREGYTETIAAPAPAGQPPGPGGAAEAGRHAALLAEAHAMGYELVPHGRIFVGPTVGEQVAARTAEAQKALAEHRGEPLRAEGPGTYLVTFPGESATAVDAGGREEAIEKAKAQVGVISYAGQPLVVRAR